MKDSSPIFYDSDGNPIEARDKTPRALKPGVTRLRMLVAYDGTDFCGWQKQTHESRPSIQGTLQKAFENIFQEPLQVFSSGRTDAGVHARAQVIHVDVTKPVSALEKWDIAWAVRKDLPDSVSIKKVYIAPPNFHCTMSPIKKTYKYYVWNHKRRPAFLSRYSLWIRKSLDLELMNRYCQEVVGKHDFKSFQSVGTPLPHTVRTIHSCSWKQLKPNLIEFEVTGDGFLKQMVRNIVGTHLYYEKKGSDPKVITDIIKAKDRKLAGPAAEPQGLFLHRVYYPSRLDKQCREI